VAFRHVWSFSFIGRAPSHDCAGDEGKRQLTPAQSNADSAERGGCCQPTIRVDTGHLRLGAKDGVLRAVGSGGTRGKDKALLVAESRR